MNRQAGVGELEGISDEEIEALRRAGIETVVEMWSRIGRDPDKGLHLLAEQVDIGPHRLIDLLAARAIYEADKGESSWLDQPWAFFRGIRLFLIRHTLDAILILGVVIFGALVLRALGLLN